MSSRTYLAGEARHAREQARKAQGRVDDLRDDRHVRRERMAADAKVWRAKGELAVAEAAAEDLNDEHLPATIAKAQADVDMWESLAREYEDRICNDEDQVVAAAGRLEDRVHKALMASPQVDLAVVRDTAQVLTSTQAEL